MQRVVLLIYDYEKYNCCMVSIANIVFMIFCLTNKTR